MTTVAGNALPGFSGDNGPATSAELNRPPALPWTPKGNLYIADYGNNRIRMVFASGTIGTLAGNGNTAFFGDGGNSLQAALNHPQGVAVGPDGVYVADTGNHRIRRIISAIIDTVADGLDAPTGVAVDDTLSVWAADPGNGTVKHFLKGGTLTVPLPGARGVAIDPSGTSLPRGSTPCQDGNDGVSGDHRRLGSVLLLGRRRTGRRGASECALGPGGRFERQPLHRRQRQLRDPRRDGHGVDLLYPQRRQWREQPCRADRRGRGGHHLRRGPRSRDAGDGRVEGSADRARRHARARERNARATAVLVRGTGLRDHSVECHGALGGGGRAVRECLDRALPVVGRVGIAGIFTADSTGAGQARALNANGTSNGRGSPAVPGTPLTFFLTGDGGGRAEVAIGGVPAEIQSTSRPFPGVAQVTVTFPGT